MHGGIGGETDGDADGLFFLYDIDLYLKLKLVCSPITAVKMKSEPRLWPEPFKSGGRWLATGSVRFVLAPERLTCSSDP